MPLFLPIYKTHRFRLSLFPSIAFIIVLSVLLKLGFWQLNRATYKEAKAQAIQHFQKQHPDKLTFDQALKASAKFGSAIADSQLQIEGYFDTKPIIFLDNRIMAGKAGLFAFGVFRPLTIDDGKGNRQNRTTKILVNLGWLPWPNNSRQRLPELTLTTKLSQLSGKLFSPNQAIWTLEDQQPKINQTQHSHLIQKIDFEHLSRELDSPLAPFTLRLADSNPAYTEPANTIRAFTDTVAWAMPPEKHRGYAFQWFAMAAALGIIYLVQNIKRQVK